MLLAKPIFNKPFAFCRKTSFLFQSNAYESNVLDRGNFISNKFVAHSVSAGTDNSKENRAPSETRRAVIENSLKS